MLPNKFHQPKLLGASDSTFEIADFPLLVAVFGRWNCWLWGNPKANHLTWWLNPVNNVGYFFHHQNHCVIGLNLPFLPQKIWNVPWQSFQMRCCHDIVWSPAFSLSKFSLPPFHSSRFQNKIHVGRCWSCSRAVSISTLDFLETHLPWLGFVVVFFVFNGLGSHGITHHHLSTSTLG